MISPAALDDWLRALPKAELHLHTGGALRWSTVREVHPDDLPPSPPWLPAPAGGFTWQHFVDCFRRYLIPATGTPELVERHVYEVLCDLAAQGVRYAEPISGTRFHSARGMTREAIWEAHARALQRAHADTGIHARVILGLFREPPIDGERRQTTLDELDAELAIAGPDGLDLLGGVDLQGDETQGDPAEILQALTPLFARAASAGLRLKIHAGELAGPHSVRAALAVGDAVGAPIHLSHGTRAIEDPALVDQLAATGTWLHMCPTSNALLPCAGVPDIASHPLPALRARGCRVTLNSDDPLLFGVDLLDEYRLAHDRLGLDRRALADLARASLDASQLDASTRAALLDELALLTPHENSPS